MNSLSFHVSAVAICILAIGCNSESPVVTGEPPATPDTHEHPQEGPHHGHLIELGDEEYHVELLHDDESGKVSIYVLDASAKEEVKISAADVTLNIVVAGTPRQFKLNAVGASDGGPSQFEIVDKDLLEALEGTERTNARLSLSIDGKPYTGKIEHHAHGEHDHDHKH